ncbi:hypothetical protein A2U01_0083118, partial [Trifolium medium]|nr:hypothetical protein [Trifolium medium]
ISVGTVGIRGDEDGGIILPKQGMGTEMRNILGDGARSDKISSAQSPPR